MSADNDPALGWVSVQEIRNVFSVALRKLDVEIWPDRTTGNRDQILKHFETVQYELYKRCKRSFSDFVAKGGVVLKKGEGLPGAAPEPSNRELHEKRLNELRGRR